MKGGGGPIGWNMCGPKPTDRREKSVRLAVLLTTFQTLNFLRSIPPTHKSN